MLAQLHGDTIAEKVRRHRLEIQCTSMSAFEETTGANWCDIRWRVEDCPGEQSLAGVGHEWYITLDKLSGMDTAAVTAAQARNFLFVHFGLNQFFAGTARTRPPSVRTSDLPSDFPGIPEFLCSNVDFSQVKAKGASLVLKFDREADKAYLDWLRALLGPEAANVTPYHGAVSGE